MKNTYQNSTPMFIGASYLLIKFISTKMEKLFAPVFIDFLRWLKDEGYRPYVDYWEKKAGISPKWRFFLTI